MNLVRQLLTIFLFLYYSNNCYSQFWHLPNGKDKAVIPFELVNNLILVSVKLNGESLSFLLDNGVKETLLFGEIDSLRLKNTSSFFFRGLGIGMPIQGKMSRQNQLEIGNIIDSSHNLYVVVDSAFNLSKNVGEHIHGILGSSFFRNNVIAIDYIKKKIIFSRNIDDLNLKLSKYQKHSIDIENDRAYVFVDFQAQFHTYQHQKMLLDLGNSDPMLIFDQEISDYKIKEPSIRDYLGYGFNGAVYGYKNRLKSLTLGDYIINYPIVSYPDTNTYDASRLAEARVGSVGNQILSRFYVLFDYPNNALYLRKNKHFDDPYALDMSGLEVVHEGFEFVKHRSPNHFEKGDDGSTTINFSSEVNYLIELHATFVINQVRPNSPAESAGLLVGDRIVKINGRRVGKLKLQDIKNKLQAGQDKLIRIQVERLDKILNLVFRLVDPLSIVEN